MPTLLHLTSSDLPPRCFRGFFNAVVVAPAVENHTDGSRLDGLTFAGTEFDEIRSGEFCWK